MYDIIMNTTSLYDQEYQSKVDKEFFIDFLDTLNNIIPVFISRKEFNQKQGNYLVKKSLDEDIEKYDLFLPSDLCIGEMLEMITTLMSKFGLDEYSKVEELFVKVKVAIVWLLREKWFEGQSELDQYIKDFNVPIYLQKIIEDIPLVGRNRWYVKDILLKTKKQRSFQNRGEHRLWQVWDSEILQSIISNAQIREFEQTFFRKWIDDIRFWMRVFTKKNYLQIIQKKESLEKWEVITLQKMFWRWYKNDILLRDAIGIDKLKSKLNQYRDSGNQKKINKWELDAVNKILKELQKYPYQLLDWGAWHKPNHILVTKQLQCVGFSLVAHAFLSELWIKHCGLDIPAHSCLKVFIGGDTYVFDATMKGWLSKIKKQKESWWIIQIQHGIRWRQTLKVKNIWNPEAVLFSHICLNESVRPSIHADYKKSLEYNERISPIIKNNNTALLQTQWRWLFLSGKYEEALEYYGKSTLLNADNYDWHLMKWKCFFHMWRYQEAIDSYNQSIKIDSSEPSAYAWKARVYESLNSYKKSIIYADKAIGLEPKSSSYYEEKANILHTFAKYRELLTYTDESLSLFPESAFLYYFRWKAGERLWKRHSSLYMYAATLISPEKFQGASFHNSIASLGVNSVQISLFIKSKNYIWLKNYLISLEK